METTSQPSLARGFIVETVTAGGGSSQALYGNNNQYLQIPQGIFRDTETGNFLLVDPGLDGLLYDVSTLRGETRVWGSFFRVNC